jgi:hypothetical protein
MNAGIDSFLLLRPQDATLALVRRRQAWIHLDRISRAHASASSTICLLASVRERGRVEIVLEGTAGCETFVSVACIFSTTARIAPAP